jgi:hypothetical protein
MKIIVASCLAASFCLAVPLLAADSQPPVVTAVALSPDPVDVTSASQTISVTITITDDDSGFQGGTINLYRPGVPSEVYVKGYTIAGPPTTGDSLNGTYEVSIQIPLYAPPGLWRVEAYVYDEFYNSKSYGVGGGREPFPIPADATFSVVNTGTADTTGPTLTNVVFAPLTLSTGAGPATVTVNFDSADAQTGINYGYFQLYDPNFNYVDDLAKYIGPAQRLTGDEFDGSYEVTATLPQGSMSGTWTLYAYMRDNVGNYTFSPPQDLVVTGSQASLSDALDAVQYTWSTSTPGWKSQSLVTHDGVDAAKSEPAADNESRTFETTVTGPGTLSFHWKVDSEQNADVLSVEVDGGSDYDEISGNVDWQEVFFQLPAGQHTVVWSYSKNSSVSIGADCGWVDQIRFIADSEVDLPVLQSVVITPNPLDVSNGGNSVTVTLEASDDYNGIYEGTVNLIDPSGYNYDSSSISLVSGDSNYGTYEVTFYLDEYVDTGNWRVEVELIEESTSNSVYYGPGDLDFPSPGQEFFSVGLGSGAGEAPLVEEISVSPASVDVTTAAATFDVTLRITDDYEGFFYGDVTINGPSGESLYTSFDTSDLISGDDYDGIYQVTVTVPRYAQAGTWTLGVSLTDNSNNQRQYPYEPPYDLPGDDSFTVVNSGAADTSDPVITSFAVSSNSVNASAAPVPITVDVTITDNLSGLMDAYLYLYDPTGQYSSLVRLEAANRTSGDELNGTYQVVLTIPIGAAQGIWTVRSYLRDHTGNSVNHGFSYPSSPPFPGPGSANITVGTAPTSTYQAFVNLYSLVGMDALGNADPDHDGIPNAAELMLGTNPTSAATSANGITVSESGGFLHLDFTVAPSLAVTTSGNFLELRDGGGGAPLRMTGQTQLGLGGVWTHVLPILQSGTTWRVSMPITPGGKGFARLFFE